MLGLICATVILGTVLAMFVATWIVVNFWVALALLVVLVVMGFVLDASWISAVIG